jgi:hypothetical protein
VVLLQKIVQRALKHRRGDDGQEELPGDRGGGGFWREVLERIVVIEVNTI